MDGFLPLQRAYKGVAMTELPPPGEPLDLNGLIVSVAEHQDRQAFGLLFEHFAPRLKAFLLGQGGAPQMAEEIVQETMVKVWRKADQFDPAKASAATWIYTIARNQRIDMIRKAQRPEPDAEDPAFAPDPVPQAFDDVSRRQEAERLHEAVTNLPADQYEVLRLAFFEEKSHAEVAEQLGIPLGTVKSRIRLAMNRMRGELGDKE
jgi:RNA polymerase sigma-70 factor (ECF subfamily)